MKLAAKLISLLSLAMMLMILPACNTTKGVGKDIEKAGAGLKNSANKNGAD